MVSADGQLVISFNGEIYNYRAPCAQLERKGYGFRSHSDTEALLHLYAEKGEAMLEDLHGMYAFVLWDGRKQGLLLARDPFGIKPLYYADDATTLRLWGSETALTVRREERQERLRAALIDTVRHHLM
jgi:asparagine synthase (glutamine-hydrolysing)